MTTEEKTKKVYAIGAVGSSIGLVGGLIYAFKKQKGFWGYVGYGLLFSTIGYSVGAVPAFVFIKEDKTTDDKTKKDDTVIVDDKKEPTKTVITKEKATELLKFYINKKKEMSVAKYTPEGMMTANLVVNSLKKSLEDGGWKVIEKDGKTTAVRA